MKYTIIIQIKQREENEKLGVVTNELIAKKESDMPSLPLIFQNQVIGLVAKDKSRREKTVDEWKRDLEKPSVYWVRGVEPLRQEVISGNEFVVDRLKESNVKISNDDAEGLLTIVGIFKNRRISDFSIFEQKKIQMIAAFATEANVLIMEDLYEGVTVGEKKELDRILVEFTVCKTILLSASSESNIKEICDRIINIDATC